MPLLNVDYQKSVESVNYTGKQAKGTILWLQFRYIRYFRYILTVESSWKQFKPAESNWKQFKPAESNWKQFKPAESNWKQL